MPISSQAVTYLLERVTLGAQVFNFLDEFRFPWIWLKMHAILGKTEPVRNTACALSTLSFPPKTGARPLADNGSLVG
jgi:hypothetical protein